MKRSLLFVLSFMTFALVSYHAHAAKFFYGTTEKIHSIQDIDIQGPSGEALFLGYKTTTQFFGAGVYLTDDGYVLGIQGSTSRYYGLSKKDIANYQNQGMLPTPLPSYQVPLLDYAIGFSVWLLLGAIVLWIVVDGYLSRMRARRDIERFQDAYPKIISSAMIADGNLSPAKERIANHCYFELFGFPLDQNELNAALQKVRESGEHYMNYIGATCKRLNANHKVILLRIYANILLSGQYSVGERQTLESVASRMKLSKRDVQKFIAMVDAEYTERQSKAAQQPRVS